jgi:hypothetical protein
MARHAGAPKRDKVRKRHRRAEEIRLRNGLTARVYEGPPLGPGMVVADPSTVLAALERFDFDRPWPELADDILPMLPRLRPHPGPAGDVVRTVVPPGILIGFGIDLGPALVQVARPLLGSWGITVEELAARALGNVRRIAAACDRPAEPVTLAEIPARLVQTGEGVAASLLLVPEQLRRIIGREPALLLAPMRDLLIALPPGTSGEDAEWIAAEIESMDPNCLHLGAFAWDGRSAQPMALVGDVAQA